MQNKLIFLGGGNMAEAIFAKLITEFKNIIVIQRNQTKLDRLKILYPSITVCANLDIIPNNNDIVFIAVKPQDAEDLCEQYKNQLSNWI